MIYINRVGLQETLNNIASCQAVSVNVSTIPSMNKGGNPYYGRVKKDSIVNGLIGFTYGNAVNNQLGREDKNMDFHPKPRKWGERVGVLVHYKGKTYLELKVQSVSATTYYLDGEEIAVSRIADFIKKRTLPSTQDKIDKKVILADYNLDNIKSIRMLGKEYIIGEVVNEPESEAVEAQTEVVG